MHGITKLFPGTLANDRVDLDVGKGEVLALLGENGAGKTTLMKILYGMYQPDEGEIRIDGNPIAIRSPQDAMRRGIGMIHQHFTLIPVHSVVENILLGGGPPGQRPPKPREAAEQIRELGQRYGLEVDPWALVRQLPVGHQQRVEILKALYREAQVLIMDEPTAVLTPQETESLFGFIREFTESGRSVIFITHKLGEVMSIADRITVMRNGRVAGTVAKAEADEHSLARMMVGRDLHPPQRDDNQRPGAAVLEIDGLSLRGDRGNRVVHQLDLQVRTGEIFGICGVSGNGQEELAEAVCGLRSAEEGSITLHGRRVENQSPREMIREGVGYIPADRLREGLVPEMSLAENLILKSPSDPPYARGGVLRWPEIYERAGEEAEAFSIKAPALGSKTHTLSGGNQQKVVVAREIRIGTTLLVAVQPTRGLDLGAADYVHSVLLEERRKGKAILLISTELTEIMALSDRIGVIYEGRIAGTFDRDDADVQTLGLLMAGIGGKRNGTTG